MFKKAFDFFIFSSLFIAVCAVLMVYQTSLLFGLSFHFGLAGFVFSGSVCSYNFHWYLTPPALNTHSAKLAWNLSNKNLHLALFILGLCGAAFFSYLLKAEWTWMLLTALLAFLYSAPKIPHFLFAWLSRIAIAKTIYLAFAWMHVTALLPLILSNKPLEPVHYWFLLNRFFFIYAICILFDYRDVDEDRKAGIRSLITLLSEKGVHRLFLASLFIFTVSCAALLFYLHWLPVLALFIPGLILSLLYRRARQSISDYLYYFVLDGLMMLSAPLLLLIKFAR
ncbi:MAG TPA: UbiA family prenyltransferase [Flavisolibacter sp.]|nr:UbiA family prenyltransferase [Flavisolibacter sp.]